MVAGAFTTTAVDDERVITRTKRNRIEVAAGEVHVASKRGRHERGAKLFIREHVGIHRERLAFQALRDHDGRDAAGVQVDVAGILIASAIGDRKRYGLDTGIKANRGTIAAIDVVDGERHRVSIAIEHARRIIERVRRAERRRAAIGDRDRNDYLLLPQNQLALVAFDVDTLQRTIPIGQHQLAGRAVASRRVQAQVQDLHVGHLDTIGNGTRIHEKTQRVDAAAAINLIARLEGRGAAAGEES